jgi:hypothetical protein
VTAHADRLRHLCDAALVRGLPPDLKAAIDEALAAGAGRAEVLRRVRGASLRAQGRGLVSLGVEAYLDSLGE